MASDELDAACPKCGCTEGPEPSPDCTVPDGWACGNWDCACGKGW